MLIVQMQGLNILVIIDLFIEYDWVDESDLDSNLWAPYKNWKEKIKNSSFEEVNTFREQMISVIEKAGKRKKEEERERGRN